MKPSTTRPTHQFQRAKFSGGTTEIKLFTDEESYNWKQNQPQAYALLLALQLPGLAADAIIKLQVKKKETKHQYHSVSYDFDWFRHVVVDQFILVWLTCSYTKPKSYATLRSKASDMFHILIK